MTTHCALFTVFTTENRSDALHGWSCTVSADSSASPLHPLPASHPATPLPPIAEPQTTPYHHKDALHRFSECSFYENGLKYGVLFDLIQ